MPHHELEELSKAANSMRTDEWVTDHSLVGVCPDDSIRDVANMLVIKDVLQVPVVSRKERRKRLGIVTLHDTFDSKMRSNVSMEHE
jgi:CIC family chloride channel protein